MYEKVVAIPGSSLRFLASDPLGSSRQAFPSTFVITLVGGCRISGNTCAGKEFFEQNPAFDVSFATLLFLLLQENALFEGHLLSNATVFSENFIVSDAKPRQLLPLWKPEYIRICTKSVASKRHDLKNSGTCERQFPALDAN